ncbi:MAG: thioredoxin domain-containing protein [Bacteroidetes bacterium]|nr:thioredoxin domain-containing protein [Bacteroidota bacterium]
MSQAHRKPNRLINETSPYLLQHAYNPVDWYPWNEDTLRLAVEQNRMILVSIGYSACHWCHVMEKESFEDEEVAKLMNAHFICIKVDREERPDVDHMFMEAVQLITGHGGWPLNCFAMPDGRPVWGGTYFRKAQWLNVVEHFARLWQNQDNALWQQADNVHQGLNERMKVALRQDEYDATAVLKAMARRLFGQADTIYGGQKGAPKFPMPDLLLFEWLLASQLDEPRFGRHVLFTLDRMHRGGIFDQLEGGFARYSTDEGWHVPHFEKMLYDNAQLIRLYAEVYRSTRDTELESALRRTIQWCMDALYRPGEMFCAALDADSEGEEGRYYVWSKAEFDELPGDIAPILSDWFGIGGPAAWEHGKNVLVRPYTTEEFCRKHQLEPSKWSRMLSDATEILCRIRRSRQAPQLDDKQILSWNALMIMGLCNASLALGIETYLQTARDVARFIRLRLRTPEGALLRTYKNGNAHIAAFLDDYAFYIQALITLYQITFDEEYLLEAYQLTHFTLSNFYHEGEACFSYNQHGSSDLAVRPREMYDNVMPSSNAAMCMAISMLSVYFEDDRLSGIASALLQNQVALMMQYPAGFSHWGQALYMHEKKDISVLRGNDAIRFAKSLFANRPMWHLVAAATGQSAIPAVNSKTLQPGTWLWKCDYRGCAIPEKLSG